MAKTTKVLKKVLIITYYWPPSGGVGVQRWLKFAKYLPEWGWEPIILTPANPAFDLKDYSLEKKVRPETEVLKIPIWEPYSLVEKISGKKGQQNLNRGMALEGEKKGVLSRVLPWMRGNLFIPDPRVFWVKPATDFAMRILESNHVEAIITTGPPHSVHLIGRRLKKKSGLPWIADFRDPWSKWEVLHRMQLSKPAMKIHQSLERKVLQKADRVLAATPGLQQDLDELGARHSETVLNGVDAADLPANYPDNSRPDKFRIVYVGLMNEKRNPPALWETLDELCSENKELSLALEISLTGSISASVQHSLANFESLRDKYVIRENVSHQEVFHLYESAALLLLLVEKEAASRIVIPAKLYEYLTAQRPILYIGDPTNGAGEIIHEQHAGKSFYHHEKEKIKAYISSCFQEYKEGNISRSIDFQAYLRKNQARKVAEVLRELTSQAEE
jgi:glycosyltransferase involved in cell wall biosynthesis